MYYCLLLVLGMYLLRDVSTFAEFKGFELISCLATIGSLLCWLGAFMCAVHSLISLVLSN